MLIHRVEVEEGFLDGLDLSFSPHLNVLIGPRGSGKTSLVELIRYCLGVESANPRSGKAAREHALSILGSGRVTVTIREDGREARVSRSADDIEPRVDGGFTSPRVYSQGEIESVGLEASGRLRILDGFLSGDVLREGHPVESGLVSRVRSLTAEIASLLQALDAEDAKAADLASARDDLSAAEGEQAELHKTLTHAEDQQAQLRSLGAKLAEASVRQETVDHALRSLKEWIESLEDTVSRAPRLPTWPDSAGTDDQLSTFRERLGKRSELLRREMSELEALHADLKLLHEQQTEERSKLEDSARDLRRQLDHLSDGAGAASKRVSVMQERVAQLEATLGRKSDLKARLAAMQEKRAGLLRKLDDIRRERFAARKAAAQAANSELGPVIEIRVERGGLDEGYANAIREGLRGSGLHYNTLAPGIAEKLSPWELAEAAETGDSSLLARVLSIPDARAQRVLAELRTADLGRILSTPMEDSVTMMLLDGRDFKPTNELSTGQRCTVVLSALLAQQGPPLLVDQPEDHLDNAFIVETLIGSILRTKSGRQLIFTTHNPNIPVLGGAEKVVLLGSSGRSGFVRSDAPVDSAVSVDAITTVMEGGAEAFKRRAEFYELVGGGLGSQ